MDIFHQILKKYYGYSSFRPLQLDIIQSVYEGHDTLALMPTGGGKSITFQVPALAKGGTCLVVSPLIALMKDQVENLRKKGINAMAIHSGLTRREIDIALDNVAYGSVKFLYLSPERLGTELFLERLQKMTISMIAVDESHCISQWGYDFRPSFLEIAKLREHLPDVPILAVTATATPEVAAPTWPTWYVFATTRSSSSSKLPIALRDRAWYTSETGIRPRRLPPCWPRRASQPISTMQGYPPKCAT